MLLGSNILRATPQKKGGVWFYPNGYLQIFSFSFPLTDHRAELAILYRNCAKLFFARYVLPKNIFKLLMLCATLPKPAMA